MDKRRAWDTAQVVGALLLMWLATVYARGGAADRAPQPRRAPVKVTHWREALTGGHRRGAAQPAVEIVEFADYECPYCGALESHLERVVAKYPGRVALTFRNFPLSGIHPYARAAAGGAECAAQQGRFWQYHDALFANQSELGVWSWARFATMAEVADKQQFNACLAKDGGRRRIASDSATAVELGAPGTPTVIVDGWMIDGTPTEAGLDSLVQQRLAAQKSTPR